MSQMSMENANATLIRAAAENRRSEMPASIRDGGA